MTRTTALSVSARRPLGIALLLGILLALVGGLFSAPPAHAEVCVPNETTACVQGAMKTSTGDPAVGVELQLTGAGDDRTTTTADDGTWSFTLLKAGTVTVTVNEATLPEGQFLKSAGSREITVEMNRVGGGLFPLTDSENAASEGSESSNTQPSESPEMTESVTGDNDASASSFSWARLWQQAVSGIRLGLLIALASVGLSLIFGTTGLSNFAHGEMVSLGGLIAAAMMAITGNLWLAGAITVAALAAFGWVQDKLLWKPLRKRSLSLMQLMIVSIGLSIAMQFTLQFFFGAGVIRIDPSTPKTVNFLGASLTEQSILAMAISLVMIILVGVALMFTRFGRATRAIADNPPLARASGIDVDRIINLVWIVGAGLAGLSGLFLGLVFNGLTFFTGGQMLLLFFAAVTLGGLGTAFGAFVGSMIVGMMVELTNIWLPGDLKFATALFLLILILLVRPQGIFGRKERIG